MLSRIYTNTTRHLVKILMSYTAKALKIIKPEQSRCQHSTLGGQGHITVGHCKDLGLRYRVCKQNLFTNDTNIASILFYGQHQCRRHQGDNKNSIFYFKTPKLIILNISEGAALN